MGNTGSSQKVSSQDRAILDLKIQRDKIYQYQKRITALTDRETEIAKECLARNDKRRALLALRRKKYQETLLSKTDSQLAQLEQLTGQVEFALVQKDVLFGLQQGTKVLQAINKEIGGIEAVDRLMEETAEARAYQEEVSQMLEGTLSTQDEEDVEEELEALRQEVAGPVHLPAVPTEPLPERPQQQVEEESQERASQAETRTPVLAS
ncbi:hypothetical protein PDE_06780 [Penicillium oxalicum 114-2]|uniref:Uncharacterized protein n=2 Tax=Penicillium oxalicum TaxID=69781 RepID=S8BAL2_PENO1|nr:hypothetical protein PDE_06780 [Penicillium oxalicum 114-2]